MPEIVIIGAGFAGVATAWALTREARRDVLVLERDPAPGQRASGRNAGMIRTLMPDEAWQRLALDSTATLRDPPDELRGDWYRATGGLVLATEEDAAPLRVAAERCRARGVAVNEGREWPVRWLDRAETGVGFEVPADGVADVHGLLGAYLEAARAGGATLRTGVEVRSLVIEEGRAVGVETDDGPIRADVVVNAAGAWAGRTGAAGSARAISIEARRRHLFTTGPVPAVDPDLPFIWHDSHGYYFRPESGGFLLSACDETTMDPDELAVDPGAEEHLAAKLVERVPAVSDLPVAKVWACQRTFSRDGRPVVGFDPALPGLYWVAALGGHGVTVSAAVAALAAREIASGHTPAGPLSPARF